MKRWSRVRRAALWIAVLAGIAGALLPFARGSIAAGAALMLVALVAGQVAVWSGSMRATGPSIYELARKRLGEPPERPEDLEQLERTLGWRVYSKRDFDHRVRPLLERLLTYKVLASRGAPPADAGNEIDELLRTDADATRSQPEGGRVATADLARLIGYIEKR